MKVLKIKFKFQNQNDSFENSSPFHRLSGIVAAPRGNSAFSLDKETRSSEINIAPVIKQSY